MAGRTLSERKQRVFDSVFGGAIPSQPTPVATPAAEFTAPGQPFGTLVPLHQEKAPRPSSAHPSSPPSKGYLGISSHVHDQVRWDRSWHLVTRTLALPRFPENRGILEPLKPEREALGSDFPTALADILYPQVYIPFAHQTEDIIVWHTSQVRSHFIHQVLPIILRLRNHDDPEAVLVRSVKILETAHRQYFHGLSFIEERIDKRSPGNSSPMLAKFRRDLHAVVNNSVMEPLAGVLVKVLKRQVCTILGLPQVESEIATIAPENSGSERSRRELLGLLESLKHVGLAGETFQVTFAEVMNDVMMEYVYRGYSGVWSQENLATHLPLTSGRSPGRDRASILPRTAHSLSPSRCVTELCEWIENRYAKLSVQVLNMLDTKHSISWTDKEKYKAMSIGRLAELRTKELFDIVGGWPASNGALDDLRTAIATPQRRLRLTEVFSDILEEKLLHPGTSTLQILQAYISMIWSFHSLDHSKVLLDRVAYPLQLYLCSREDTVRIIIAGLLSDTEDAQGSAIGAQSDRLVELAQLLNSGSDQIGQGNHDEELDWHDMEWVPDPVDAGPGYKRSKSADIIGTLIGVLGAQDVFIKEFQNIIGENLLKNDGAFEKEVCVLAATHFGSR